MDRDTRRKPRLHDWLSLGAAVLALGAVVALVLHRPAVAAACATIAVGGAVAARRASQRDPGPMPYALRWVLYLPRWPLSPARLQAILAPRPGERVLELGPGVGIYALPIATALQPGGTLEALDVQPAMLATLAQRARAQDVANVVAVEGDAQRLPYPDAHFDAAYLVDVLGEIPDADAALRELRRVLRPGGRLVLGEILGLDPDAVRLAVLCAMATRAGFRFDRRLGPSAAYFARFHVPSGPGDRA